MPPPEILGMGIKAQVYTLLLTCQGLKVSRGSQSPPDLPDRQMNMQGPQGQQGQPPATGPPGGGQKIMPAAAAPQARAAPQGGAQITVQPGGNTGVGMSLAGTGRGTHGSTSHEYSGISMSLERLAPFMTDADTSRNLR